MSLNDVLGWYHQLGDDPEMIAEQAKIDFAVAIERLMGQIGISKSELAKRIDTSPAYVTKVLRGDTNLTIESMANLSHAVDGCLHIHVAPASASVRWFEVASQDSSLRTPQPADQIAIAWQKAVKDPSRGKIAATA